MREAWTDGDFSLGENGVFETWSQSFGWLEKNLYEVVCFNLFHTFLVSFFVRA